MRFSLRGSHVLLRFMTVLTVFIKMDIVPLYRALPSSVFLSTKTSDFSFSSWLQRKCNGSFCFSYLISSSELTSVSSGWDFLLAAGSRCKESSFHFKSPSGWRHSRLKLFFSNFQLSSIAFKSYQQMLRFCVSFAAKNHDKLVNVRPSRTSDEKKLL